MFNTNALLYQMLASLATAYGPKYEEVKGIAEEMLWDSKERLTELAKQALDGKPISEVKEFVKDELSILKSHLFATEVVLQSEAEQAWNGAVDIFEKVIEAIVGTE